MNHRETSICDRAEWQVAVGRTGLFARRRFLLIALWPLVTALLLGGLSHPDSMVAAEPPASPTKTTAVTTVELVIDYGDGVQKRFTRIAHVPQMTVLDLLQAAAKHPRGIKFEHRGKGETGFLTRIDELTNEGRGRNWVYRVNDKLGERSFAAETLKAGDVVSWTFGTYQETK